MSDHLRRTARFHLIVAVCPFALGFISSWTADIGFLLLILGGPVLLVTLAFGNLLFLWRGAKLASESLPKPVRTLAASAAPAMLAVTILAAWPSLAAGSRSGTWTRLIVNKASYERIIARAKRPDFAPGVTPYLEAEGITFMVDAGPPVRVAFNPEGLLDNWSGIIFDPTHDVMLADGFDPVTGAFAGPDRVTRLFGGDLVSCRELYGDYFYCSFT